MYGKFWFLFFLLALMSVAGVAAAQEAVPAPVYKEGDTWRVALERSSSSSRSDTLPAGTYKVVFRGGKFLWFPDGDESKEPWEGLIESDLHLFFGEFKEIPALAFPMKVGDTRNYSYFNPRVGRRGMNLDGTIKVEGIEIIEHAGQKIQVYKHTRSEHTVGGERRYTYYYLPSCKAVVRLDAEFTAVNTTHAARVVCNVQ